MLKKPLMIEFSGEEGADAGALLFEFTQEVVRQVRSILREVKGERSQGAIGEELRS